MNTFEDKLLGELKQVVAERTPAPAPVRPRWRPRLLVTAGVAAALGLIAAVGIPLLRADEASPAWAVTPGDDGTVIVTITDLRDADGLEHRLEEAGVRAEVDFIPGELMCKVEPRYQTTKNKEALRQGSSPEGHVQLTLRPDAFQPDETLVITTSLGGYTDGGSTIEWSGLGVSIAKGPVVPCELVPDPLWGPHVEASPAQIER